MNLLTLVLELVLSITISGHEHAYWIEVIKSEPVAYWSEVGEDTFSVDKEDDYDKSYYYHGLDTYADNKRKNQPIIYDHGYNYDTLPVYGWDSSSEGFDSYKSIYGSDWQQKPNCPYPSYPQIPQQAYDNFRPYPSGKIEQPTIDTQQRQDGQQTSPDLPPGNNNGNILNTLPKPFYRPTLQNSTSLQMCRNYYGPAPTDQGVFVSVVGGENANPKEFPHMALLGYGEPSNIQWSCGGTLISNQFVLTAAHCLRHRVGPVQYVRLGELDLSTTTEDSDVKDFTVSEVFKHPMYRSFVSYYDIALLRLNTSVSFNDYIKPSCLATINDLDGGGLLAAGWGKLEDGGADATILQKAYLTHVSNERCRNIYGTRRNFGNGIVEEIQVCADGGNERRDTCQGDSGGPLQRTNNDYNKEIASFIEVVGVTSFGGRCGVAPGVYTRVAPFVDWIEKIVWPK